MTANNIGNQLEYLRCPVSRQPLTLVNETLLQTKDGSHSYPIVHGIADFRLFEPPYMTRAEEHAIVDELAKVADDCTYQELIEKLETELVPHSSPEQIEKGIAHRSSLRFRAPQRMEDLVGRVGGISLPANATALDLGCGSGEATIALQGMGAEHIIGIDISLVELFLAKKLYKEQGISAELVAGCAEALPFRDELFDFVYSPDVIEHVSDQHDYLSESNRVLTRGGKLLLNSPNRYSVVCPEPHVGIWFLTFLPRPLIDPVTRLLGKGPYIGKRLISLRELRQILKDTHLSYQVVGRRSNPAATSFPGRLYKNLSPFSEDVFAHFCDQHIVLATSDISL